MLVCRGCQKTYVRHGAHKIHEIACLRALRTRVTLYKIDVLSEPARWGGRHEVWLNRNASGRPSYGFHYAYRDDIKGPRRIYTYLLPSDAHGVQRRLCLSRLEVEAYGFPTTFGPNTVVAL